MAVYHYNTSLKKILNAAKYPGSRTILEALLVVSESRMLDLIRQWIDGGILSQSAIIVPIPLYTSRSNTRGFNQSLSIARMVQNLTNLEAREDVLLRRKNTPHQARLASDQERMTNLSGAFEVSMGVRVPPSILLIDDVVTSGATVREAAKTLKNAGCKHILVLSLARG